MQAIDSHRGRPAPCGASPVGRSSRGPATASPGAPLPVAPGAPLPGAACVPPPVAPDSPSFATPEKVASPAASARTAPSVRPHVRASRRGDAAAATKATAAAAPSTRASDDATSTTVSSSNAMHSTSSDCLQPSGARACAHSASRAVADAERASPPTSPTSAGTSPAVERWSSARGTTVQTASATAPGAVTRQAVLARVAATAKTAQAAMTPTPPDRGLLLMRRGNETASTWLMRVPSNTPFTMRHMASPTTVAASHGSPCLASSCRIASIAVNPSGFLRCRTCRSSISLYGKPAAVSPCCRPDGSIRVPASAFGRNTPRRVRRPCRIEG